MNVMKDIKTVNPPIEKKVENELIIFAPHPDDEIIGCYEVLIDETVSPIILYSATNDQIRVNEALKLRDITNVKAQMFVKNIPGHLIDITNKYYFPNPIYETHPAHREKGHIGEMFLRMGFDVTFYSTEMNYHAKYECKDSAGKLEMLNKIYPSQKSLWEHEHKYFLFSCYEKWVII